VAIHYGHADAQEQGGHAQRPGHGPPPGGGGGQAEQPQAPPEGHFPEIVGMPRQGPQPPVHHLAGGGGGQEADQLPVGGRLDDDSSRGQGGGQRVQQAQGPSRGQRRPQGQAAQEHQHRGHEVEAGEADGPEGRARPPEVGVAPVLVRQPSPAAASSRSTGRPGQQQRAGQRLPTGSRRPRASSQNRARNGALRSSTGRSWSVVGQAEGEHHQGAPGRPGPRRIGCQAPDSRPTDRRAPRRQVGGQAASRPRPVQGGGGSGRGAPGRFRSCRGAHGQAW
jgi:hypothetical protein